MKAIQRLRPHHLLSLTRDKPANTRHRTRHFLETLEDRTLLSVASQYGRIPMSFQLNQGQADSQVAYLARGSGYGLFLTGTETVLTLQAPAPASPAGTLTTQTATPAPATAITTRFVGANPSPTITGVNQDVGTTNYFVGNDPSKWLTNVPSFGKVQYQNLYNGVNLVFYGNGTQLEYDYVVSPGADPSVIKMSIGGADSVTIDAQGNLIIHTGGGDVQEKAPVVYQDTAAGRQSVPGQFVIAADGTVGFKLGAYDTSKALVIDPTLVYSTYLGGSGVDSAEAIAVDGSGSAYITGSARSTNFPTTPGAFQSTLVGVSNAFVTKLNPTGTAWLYSTYLGGTGGSGIAVDGSGNAYITGSTQSTNFPTTPGAVLTSGGGFVTELNPTGSGLVYSTYLTDAGTGIALDGMGNAYVEGTTASTTMPTTPGALQPQFGGKYDVFVAKLNHTGTAFLYSTYLGGSDFDSGYGITVDGSGNAYVTGSTSSTDFPTTPGSYEPNSVGDSFVAKLNPSGTALLYSTHIAGSSAVARAIAVDSSGNAYVAGGIALNTFLPTNSAAQTVFGGRIDGFVLKLNPAGTDVIYATLLGGSSIDMALGIAVDATGSAYVTGYTFSPNFPTTPDGAINNIGYAAYLTKLSPTGNAFAYSTTFGGSNSGQGGTGITLDGSGDIFVAGYTGATNFPTTPGAAQTVEGGSQVGFVMKLSLNPVGTLTATTISGSSSSLSYGQSTSLTSSVGPLSGTGTPTGSVIFTDSYHLLNGTSGTTTLGIAPLAFVNGVDKAIFNTPVTLAAGAHSFSATYVGDGTFASSTTTTSFGASVATANLTISAGNPSKTYGSTLVSPSTSFTSLGLVNNETIGTVTLTSSGGSANATVAGSPYVLNISGAAGGTFNPNNYAITYVSGNLNVIPATLTVTAANQDVGHGDAFPFLGYGITGFVNKDDPSVIVGGPPILKTTATDTNTAGVFLITVNITGMSAANYKIVAVPGVLTVHPKVLDVRVNYGNQSMSILNLNRDLPFINIQSIDVLFSDNVNVDQSMLQMLGVNVPRYGTNGFVYNPATRDATWTLPTALGPDRVTLSTTGASLLSGGVNILAIPYATTLSVLPGDVNGDGIVTAADMIVARNDMTGPYQVWADVNGDDAVAFSDLLEIRKRNGSHLP